MQYFRRFLRDFPEYVEGVNQTTNPQSSRNVKPQEGLVGKELVKAKRLHCFHMALEGFIL
jgi:hypothetical protein